ncbi:hypothetical protein [Sinorhizobium meliloti]|uniref:hypothetical protein n=1 Tax=Rhizobium meliloti TaxID=382 RepID=UPI0004134099|nr:hypothetical protein [Sinorhizobium meliloti]MDE4620640.1 hypothetical protein [Sinorhizobium meliloti]
MSSIAIDRTDGLQSSTAIKGPVRVATTANISLSGLQAVDGVSLVVNDRVLVKDQAAGSENGIYVVDTGSWRRSKDFNKTRDVVKGTQVFVTSGTISAKRTYSITSDDPIAVGTDTITFALSDSLDAAQEYANIAQAAANNNLVFVTKEAAADSDIAPAIHSVMVKGNEAETDGEGGLYADADNGSDDTFQDAGGRTFYRSPDVSFGRLGAQLTRELELISAPSARPEDWDNQHEVMFRALETRSISRVVPVQYLKFGSTHVLLAQSRHFDGVSSSWGTSLFLSDDLSRWRESRANPIFNQIEYAWQGERAMGQALVWDHQQEKWALFFSADGSAAIQAPPYNSQGYRAIGLARSLTLENESWDINPDPVVLVEDADILSWYGSTAERVYCAGVPIWFEDEGMWYMPVTVGMFTGGNPFKTGIVKAATLDGPWQSIVHNPIAEGDGGAWEGNQVVGNSWVKIRGTWYMPYKGNTNKIGLLTRVGHPDGVWTKTPNPLIEPTYTPDRTTIVPAFNGWKIVASSDNGGQNLVAQWAERGRARVFDSDPIGGRYSWPLGYRNNRYYYPPVGKIGTQTVTVTAGTIYAVAIPVTKPVRVSQLVTVVTTGAAGNAVLGMYSNRNGYPGELVFQGAASSHSSAAAIEQTVDKVLDPGIYWLVAQFEGTPTLRAFTAGDSMADAPYGWFTADPTSLSSHSGWQLAGTYSATLANLFSDGAAGASAVALPRIGFKAEDFAV